MSGELRAWYREQVAAVGRAAREYYGDRLAGGRVFGSVGRDRPHPGSDIDVLLVIHGLAPGPRVGQTRPRRDLGASHAALTWA